MTNIAHKVNKIYVGKPNPKYYNIPSEYTQLEYIQTTGNEYINTGVYPTANTKVTADFQVIEKKYGFELHIFGAWDDNNRIRATISCNNTFDTSNVDATFSQTSNLFARTQVTSLPKSPYNKNGNNQICIFSQGDTQYSGIIKLYNLKIYESDILIRNFIPCFRNSDNICGLYDIINNIFYTNENQLPSEYQRVEYIESTGTQYINTEYTVKNETGFLIRFLTTNEVGSSEYGALLGTSNTSSPFENAYYLETWTNDEQGGRFKRGKVPYDPKIVKNTKICMGHSSITNTLVRNDNTYVSVNSDSYTSPNYQYLFAMNRGSYFGKMKLYSMVYYESYTIVHDYIPCIRIADNKPGLYNVRINRFFTNSGTDEFLYGDVINDFIKGDITPTSVAYETTNKYIGGPHPLSKNLPQAYQQVEYIQNDGFKHIDTGIETNENLTAEVDFQVVEYKPGFEACICGIYNNTSRMRVLINTSIAFFASNGTFSQTTDLNARTTATFKPETEYASPDGTLWIFAQNTYENHQKNAIINKIRIYSLKIYDNNELIRDFVPAKRKNDNILGLYDIVNNIFYTPIEKISNEYQRIKYIESTGTQYINTNYNPVTLTGSYCEFQCPTIGTTTEYDTIFGSYDNNNTSSYQLNTYNGGRFSRNNYNYDISISTNVEKIGHSKNRNILLSTNNTSTSIDSTTLTNNYPIYIFANNSNDSIDNISKSLKLYHLILFENSRVMHEYVPVIRISDNKPGLYDEVNGEFLINNNQSGSDFLYNENIDNFICGTEINSVAHSVTNIYIGV